ncbi:MAG TPA: hypothetical protein VF557_03745 [Jatrophihabitans sp.]|jgi:hypothetical protein|uniref:hypothetical protein n=1 Tax=Jatrophihabitans sp. TaxID=1932789 RepID=UPI002EEF534F
MVYPREDTTPSDRAGTDPEKPQESKGGSTAEPGLQPGDADEKHQAWLDEEKLDSASKWAAGGFTTLIALLTFFGLKDQALDQALRRNPIPTLCVFLMLGIGVLCSLFAGTIAPFVRVRLWALLLAIMTLLCITATVLPNLVLPGREPNSLGLAGCAILALLLMLGAALCLAKAYDEAQSRRPYRKILSTGIGFLVAAVVAVVFAAFLTTTTAAYTVLGGMALVVAIVWAFANPRASLPATATIVILGVAATSLGLYGAFKVTVESKMSPVEPKISAWLEETAGRDNIKIAAAASRSRDRRLEVIVWGKLRQGESPTGADLAWSAERAEPPSDKDEGSSLTCKPATHEVSSAAAVPSSVTEIWRGVLQPDAFDEINTTLTVPIVPTRWELVAVGYRELEKYEKVFCATRTHAITVLQRRNVMGDVGTEMDGTISADGARNLKVEVAGRNIPWGKWVTLELCRTNRAGHTLHLATETLTPHTTGEISWSASVPSGRVGEGLVLRYKTCNSDGKECTQMKPLAEYNVS